MTWGGSPTRVEPGNRGPWRKSRACGGIVIASPPPAPRLASRNTPWTRRRPAVTAAGSHSMTPPWRPTGPSPRQDRTNALRTRIFAARASSLRQTGDTTRLYRSNSSETDNSVERGGPPCERATAASSASDLASDSSRDEPSMIQPREGGLWSPGAPDTPSHLPSRPPSSPSSSPSARPRRVWVVGSPPPALAAAPPHPPSDAADLAARAAAQGRTLQTMMARSNAPPPPPPPHPPGPPSIPLPGQAPRPADDGRRWWCRRRASRRRSRDPSRSGDGSERAGKPRTGGRVRRRQ